MNVTASLAPQFDSRAMLAAVGHRKVSVLAAETNEFAAALLGVLRERQEQWTLDEWNAACAELDASALTVSEWLLMQARQR